MGWSLRRDKYLTRDEVLTLRRVVEDRALADLARGRCTWVRNWAVIDFVSQTGLRVSELASVRIGDLTLSGATPVVWVVGGKGRKRGPGDRPEREPVTLSRLLVRHLRDYLKWKKLVGEGTDPTDHLFLSNRGQQISVRAVQMIFKRACSAGGLPAYYSVHSLRHSWGTYLYAKTKNLRLVQKELRHKNIQTTTVYADVTPEEAARAVNGVWGDAEGPPDGGST